MRKIPGGKPTPKYTPGPEAKTAASGDSCFGDVDQYVDLVNTITAKLMPAFEKYRDAFMRDEFAKAAIPQAMRESDHCKSPDSIALRAYQIADAAMAVRKAVARG